MVGGVDFRYRFPLLSISIYDHESLSSSKEYHDIHMQEILRVCMHEVQVHIVESAGAPPDFTAHHDCSKFIHFEGSMKSLKAFHYISSGELPVVLNDQSRSGDALHSFNFTIVTPPSSLKFAPYIYDGEITIKPMEVRLS